MLTNLVDANTYLRATNWDFIIMKCDTAAVISIYNLKNNADVPKY